MPKEAVAEIIVNAVAHRDYTSNAAVQVAVFADRIEIWNPGSLPPGLRPDDLEKPHSSEPANPLIAWPLYLAHYIENLGTGTLDVIRHCREADLPLPDFEQRGSQFVVTLWRDWLTAEVLAGLDLNDRQTAALPWLRKQRSITSAEYQRITSAPRRTALRDLTSLIDKGLLTLVGKGRGARYTLAKARPGNAPEMRQMRQPHAVTPGPPASGGNAPKTRRTRKVPTTRQKPDKPDAAARGAKRAKNGPNAPSTDRNAARGRK
jgi:predicted HTH transcriptional regulator